MKIKLIGKYKSLNSFESDELNNFTVITGNNGCGKSQLLELFNPVLSNQIPTSTSFTINPKITKIQCEGIVNINLNKINNQIWLRQLQDHINAFNSFGIFGKKLLNVLSKADMWIDDIKQSDNISNISSEIITHEELVDLITKTLKHSEPNFIKSNTTFEQILKRLTYGKLFAHRHDLFILAKHVSEFLSKDIDALTEVDFHITPIPDYYFDNPKLFGSQLELVFYNYTKRRNQNRISYFEKNEYNDVNNSISDLEFTEKYIPPWITINNILKSHSINFQFKEIERTRFSEDVPLFVQLFKTTINKEIQFENLSSGERVIIGLIIKLFTSQYYEDKLELPELLVLDEPDAYLHPDVSKLLIDVLNDTFINRLGIKVLIVTHSPTTIALCPANSIYQLKNEPTTSLKQIEKDKALNDLTAHLPTLSIDYQNHKQVFVESTTDVTYYQTIFNKVNQERKYPFKLYFIANSQGKGNCQQVINIVNDIRTSGNKTSFGIIDWDLKNNSSDYVKVHGHNKRYSIENYLYDPIYITVLLMNLKAHNIYTELGIEATYNHLNIGEESNDFLQKISDCFFVKLYEKYPAFDNGELENIDIEYWNGKKIKVPKWYLETKGHDIEEKIKNVFDAIKGKFKSEGELQKEITLLIGKCYPFIPKDSVGLIDEIIKCG